MMMETAVQEESLLGRKTSGLRLRLAGRAGQDRVITVEPARCLIGADRSCTVRLNDNRHAGRPLDPFHCLIVQGAARTIIRRISPALRLNGRDFSDAVLEPGDRLSVGSYEIEVLPSKTDPAPSSVDEVQRLQAEVERLNRVLASHRASSQVQSEELNAELAKAKAEAARSAVELEEARQSLARRQATWEQTTARWEQEHRAWHAERLLKTAELTNASKRISHLEAELLRSADRAVRLAEEAKAHAPELEETRNALQRLKADLARAEAELDQERRDRQAELAEKAAELTDSLGQTIRLEGDLTAANEHIERLAAELHTQQVLYSRAQDAVKQAEDSQSQAQAALAQERTAWQAERDLRAADLDEKGLELAAANKAISQLRVELSQAHDRIARLTDGGEALAHLRQQHAQAQAAFDDERAAWQSERSRQSIDLATAVELASSLEAELQAAKSQLERLASDAESRNTAFERQLAELTDEMEATRRAFAEERDQWERNQVTLQTNREQHLSEIDQPAAATPSIGSEPIHAESHSEPPNAELADTGRTTAERTNYESVASRPRQTEELLARFASAKPAEIAFHTPPSDAPVSSADLLSRFGLSVQHEMPEPPPAVPAEDEALVSPSEAAFASQPEAVAGPETTAEPAHAVTHHEDSDSIDAYMAQLMARLGKPGYAPPREELPQRRAVVETAAEPTAATSAVLAPAVTKLRDPSEMERRAMPPELATDLSAMREIANQNARAAIDIHARRALIQVWISKAAVMLLGLIAAGVETWLAMEGNDLAGYFIVPSLMIGIFWGWQYLAMSKRLSSSRDAAPSIAEGASDAEISDRQRDV